MFDIKKFIMDTLKGMIGNYPDFQVREYALNWYAKGELSEGDLAEIEEILCPTVEEVPTDETLIEEETIETTE